MSAESKAQSSVNVPVGNSEKEGDSTDRSSPFTTKLDETLESKDGKSDSAESEEKRRLEELLEENRNLKELNQCKICMDNDINVTFIPCGHLVCCSDCGKSVRHCPLCRTPIERSFRVYLG